MAVLKTSVVRLISALLVTMGLLIGTPAMAQFDANSAGTAAEPSDALKSLLEVLKDDTSREALIAELEAPVASAEPAPEPAETFVSLGRQIATLTQEAGQDAVAALSNAWARLSSGDSVFSGLRGDELTILLAALPGLLVVIAITATLFLTMRYFARKLYRRIGQRADNASGMARFGLFIASNLTDVAIVIVAWAAGYLVTLLAVGEFGQIGIRQTLYLNAFLIVELAKVIVRAGLSPIAGSLRLIPVSDYAAKALTRIFSRVLNVLGYGHLLIVPIVNQSASRAAGSGVAALLSVIVLLYLFSVVLRRRKAVADWLKAGTEAHEQMELPDDLSPEERQRRLEEVEQREPGSMRKVLLSLAGVWHWFALGYLGIMFLIVSTQPARVTFNALIGSAKILAAVIVATLLSGWLANTVSKGVSLPTDVTEKLPLLERRINRFVPRAFGLLRLLLLLFVLVFSLDVMGLLDVRSIMESQIGVSLTTKTISVSLILFFAFVLWLALTSFVDYRLNPEFGGAPSARETTLLTLMRNALTIVLIVLTTMFCLSEIGLNIGPLLASAGVLGLAIGFGAQKMVQDIITGVFIQFENAINVGDVVTVGGITGGVERLSVRSVSLRDVHGVLHIIPFSSVDMVSNFMKDFSYFVCDMGIAYREDVDEAKDAMFEAFDKLMENSDIAKDVLAPLEWFGVNSFGDNAVVLRARIKTVPGKQWGTGRAYNEKLKQVFDARGIEIPFPQQTIWLGEAKDGSTQAIRLQQRATE